MIVEVSVPGSIANLGAGFDAFALALDLHDHFRVALTAEGSTRFTGEGAEDLNRHSAPLVARAADAVARWAGRQAGFAIDARLHIPVARGLGSSAASIVGGLVAANYLLDNPLDRRVLLRLAADLEGHPDNVAAALLGGVVIVAAEGGELHTGRFLPRLDLDLVLAIPDLAVATEEARAILPRTVSLSDAVFNVSHAALLVTALLTGDESLLPPALDDRLHQPHRQRLVPGFAAVVAAARDAGAYGAVLAGSGSTIAAFSAPVRSAAVGAAMRQAFARHDLTAAIRTAQVDPHGAVVQA